MGGIFNKYFSVSLITLLVIAGALIVLLAIPLISNAQIQDQALSSDGNNTTTEIPVDDTSPSIINNALNPILPSPLPPTLIAHNDGSDAPPATTVSIPTTSLKSLISPTSNQTASTTIVGESRQSNSDSNGSAGRNEAAYKEPEPIRTENPQTEQNNSTPAVISQNLPDEESEDTGLVAELSDINPLAFFSRALSPQQEYVFDRMDPEATRAFMILALTLASLGVLLMGGTVEFIEKFVTGFTEKTGQNIDGIKKPQKKYS